MLNRFLSRVDELTRIIKRGWGFDDVQTENPNPVHVVSNLWQRVIAVLQGWDYANNVRRLISVDEYGRIGVSLTPAIGIQGNIYRYNVSINASLVANANQNRSYLIVKNLGTNDCFIGVNNAVTSSTGYPLPTSAEIKLDNWNIELWAITGTGTTSLAVIER